MWLNKPPLGVPLDWKKPINKDLVLHLAMNEGHGGKVYDLSGYGNHGTLKNFAFPPTVDSGWNPGRKGVGLNFDGSDDYINCGNNPSLNLIDALAIEAWIKTTTVATEGMILARATKKADHVYFISVYGGYFRLGVANGTTFGTGDLLHGTTVINDGIWHHVAGIFDGAYLKVYVDGRLDNQKAKTTKPTSLTTTVAIGNQLGYSLYFDGAIDEVRIYRRALISAEIRERYINPFGVYLDEED